MTKKSKPFSNPYFAICAQKKRSKKLQFSKLILKHKDDIKKAGEVIKESIRKEKCSQKNLPKKLVVGNKNISDVELIVENFSKDFTKIGPKLARGIELSSVKFDKYIGKCNITQPEFPVIINELKDVFFFSENQ